MTKLSQSCLPLALAMGLVLPCFLSAASRTTSYDSMQGRTQLNEIKDSAYSIERAVGNLGQKTQYGIVDWHMQTFALNQVKADVNNISKDIRHMDKMKGELTPWEQRELKRITPLEVEMADATTDAIHDVNQRANFPNPPLAMQFNVISEKAQAVNQSVNESEKVANLRNEVTGLKRAA